MKHLPKGSELLDMGQGEALTSIDLPDPEVVVQGLADQALLFRYLKDLGRDISGSETMKP